MKVEKANVPKMIVVFVGDPAAAAAEAVAAGGKSVRFTEVEVRAAAETTTRHQTLDPKSGDVYDGVVLVVDGTAVGHERVFEAMRRQTTEHTVFADHGAIGLATGLAATLGGIVVAVKPEVEGAERATAIGAKVARVAGWVRHGLGHEAEHHHAHHHDHDHHHG